MPACIAIIDDDTAICAVVADVLENEGYEVVQWHRGAGALALLRQVQPALVLLDIRMETPEAGWLVLEGLRADPCLAQLPVIVCSADCWFLRERAARLCH